METSANTHPFRTGLLQLAAFVALAVGVPALLPERPPETGHSASKAASASQEIDRLQESRPEVVVIGDSMVPCRIDPDQLGKLLGRRCRLLSFNGSASASWFLLLKNVVAKTEPPPPWVVVFFRDDHFHYPAYRTTGPRKALLDSLRVGNEPELERVLTKERPGSSKILDEASVVLDKTFRVDSYRDHSLDRLRNAAMDVSSLGNTKKFRAAALDYIFDIKHLRGDLQTGEDTPGDAIPAWSDDPTASFLPLMAETAKKAGFRLCLYRVRTRDLAAGKAQKPEMTAYIDGLKAWAARNGVTYADETTDSELTLAMYADGDHTKESARSQWTTRAAEHLKPVLQGAP